MKFFKRFFNRKVADNSSSSYDFRHHGNDCKGLGSYKKIDQITSNERPVNAVACLVQQIEAGSTENSKTEVVKNINNKHGISFFNFLKLKRNGHNFFMQKIKACNCTVYKISMGSPRIMLCDHISVRVVFDEGKVEKDLGFGSMEFNPVMMKGFLPVMFANGCEHVNKKNLMLRLQKNIGQNFSFEELELYIENQFKTMTTSDWKKRRFEDVVSKAVGSVVTKVMLGKPIDDLTLLENWLEKSLEFKYSVDFTDDDEKDLAKRFFLKFKDSPVINMLREFSDDSPGIVLEDAIKNLVWTTVFNAFGGVKNLVLSSISLYLKLSPDDKALLHSDGKSFFQTFATNRQELLPTLPTLDAFFCEVVRLFPPATSVFARAKHNFILESTSGNYHIEKGEMLCGYIYAAQRDPTLFERPDMCLLNRDLNHVRKHLFTFGGPYNMQATSNNHKCIGQNLSEMIVKLFILYITRCKIVPDRYPTYTGRKFNRFVGTDYPLSVKAFQFEEIEKEN